MNKRNESIRHPSIYICTFDPIHGSVSIWVRFALRFSKSMQSGL